MTRDSVEASAEALRSGLTPNRIESRLGVLEFKDGTPSGLPRPDRSGGGKLLLVGPRRSAPAS